MERSIFSSAELRLARERRLKFQGTAKINISQISLPSDYRQDNVERLRRVFESDDCDRLLLPNHVVATISREHLMSALSGNEVNANSLMSQPPDGYAALEYKGIALSVGMAISFFHSINKQSNILLPLLHPQELQTPYKHSFQHNRSQQHNSTGRL